MTFPIRSAALAFASRVLAALALGMSMPAAICGAAERATDLGERLAACATCHGEHGEGAEGAEYYPHLAGKPAGYLLAQLQGFRDGRRHYPQMVYLMQFLDDAYLGEIAAWYAAQPTRLVHREPSPIPLDAAAEARARQLVFDGDPASGLPACARCHGPDLAGLEPGVPALGGLPADYVIAQIGGWRNGARKAVEPDCMAVIANRLSARDTRIVATWLSRQLPAIDSRPAERDSRPLPLACGELPRDANADSAR